MTTIYFIRHAESDQRCHDDQSRPLTAKGMEDRKLVTKFLAERGVQAVISSPYRRAVDTVSDFAARFEMPIRRISAFRERKVGNGWIEDFQAFARRQWADFDYRLPGGESLREVQRRNITALKGLLEEFAGQTFVIGGHGTAISTVLNYYDPSFGYEAFARIRPIMPWAVRLTFCGGSFAGRQTFDLFEE